MSAFARKIFLSAIAFYRYFLSPYLGGQCRYYPSCSEYAQQCFEEHDCATAICLSAKRLKSCHPLGGSGYDPVPKGKGNRS